MPNPLLRTERLTLQRPRISDRDAFIAAVGESRDLHEPWAFPPADALAFAAYVKRVRKRDQFGFIAKHAHHDALVGVVNINNVVFGGFRSGYLGYYAFRSSEGRGLMTEAVRNVVDYAFTSIGLHRLEANIQPDNEPSINLVKRLNFRLEGMSPNYLRIAGEWRDHERWAITAER